MICCVPYAEGEMLRFSATYLTPTEHDEDALMAEFKDRLDGVEFEF